MNSVALTHQEFSRATQTKLLNLFRSETRNAHLEGAAVRLLELHERAAQCSEGTSWVDARMLPHEWLRTGRGLVKVDAIDHGNDHFYPGPRDIAWDLAGAIVEFNLAPSAVRVLLRHYVTRSGDTSISARLPFYRAAYLAFRVGYCAIAQQGLGASLESERFAQLEARYSNQLRRKLSSP